VGWESYLRTFAVSLKCTGSQRNTDKKNKDREREEGIGLVTLGGYKRYCREKMWKGRRLEELSGRS